VKRAPQLFFGAWRRWGLVGAFLLFCAFLAVATPSGTFLSGRNAVFVLLQISVNTVLAAGMTMVILSRGIDLSVGSVVALSGVVGADLVAQGTPVPVAAVIALGVGALVGLINGMSIVFLRVAPFIATLATMTAARGLAYLYTDGISIGNLPGAFTFWGNGRIGHLPVPVFVAAAVVTFTAVVLGRTIFGRRLYALGGNEEAARLAGVRVGGMKLTVYTVMGALAGLGGLLLAARLGAGDPKAGQLFELTAIAAVVVGGTSLTGGRGGVWGTVLGALIIGVLDNGLVLMDVSAFWQMVVKGLVILGAVALDRGRS
jgi:ribose/xylose/arabinose/galactoside ABC-type transport system permease subunit